MTFLYTNLIFFSIAVVIFAIYAFNSFRGITSAKSFFYQEDLRANTISLTATNITLGTGLAYLIQGGSQSGILMLLVPVMVWLGYFLLANFIARFVANDVLKGANYVHAINNQISLATNTPSHFNTFTSISLIIIFTLILPFEIFASSKIMAPLLIQGNGIMPQVLLSLVIFFIALAYVLLGGVKAVLATDKIQLGAILLFILALLYVLFTKFNNQGYNLSTIIKPTLKFDTNIVLGVIAACISALSTQFYSLLNWGYISQMEKVNSCIMLKRVGLASAIIFTLIISLGVFYPQEGSDVISDIVPLILQGDTESVLFTWIISCLAILGMTSIVFSTIDSLIIKIVMFYYHNIAKRDSKDDKNSPEEIQFIRYIVFLSFGSVFLILGYFNFIQPNIFYLLLAIVAGINVFAPMLATAGYLSHHNTLAVLKNTIISGYVFLFLLASVTSIYFFFFNQSNLGWVGTVSFVVSLLYSMGIILFSKKSPKDKKTTIELR